MILDLGSGHLTSHYSRGQINVDIQKPPNPPENFILADAHNLPFSSNRFNQVIFYDVIEHVENPSQVLREIARVLKPGGRIHISTPNPLHYRNFFRLARNKPLEVSGTEHISTWTEKEMRNLLTNTGFYQVTISYVILPATKHYDASHMWIDLLARRLLPAGISGRNMIIHAVKK